MGSPASSDHNAVTAVRPPSPIMTAVATADECTTVPASITVTTPTTSAARDRPARPLDYPALTALSDGFYARVILRLGWLVPAGTVYFHADNDLLASQSDRQVLASAGSHRFGNGFFDQSAQLWGHEGALLATSHQLVYFKG